MKIEYTSLERVDSYREALGEVARERNYLLFTDCPEKSQTLDFVQSIIRSGDTQFFAIMNDRVVGWCDITRIHREGVSHVGHLGMGVVALQRGKGIGSSLLAKAIEHAFANGVTRIEMEVFASNQRAIQLYQKFGFIIEGTKRKARYLEGRYDDFIIFSLLRGEH